MMKMNAGIWIGIVGGIIGLLVGIAAVITTTGSMGIYFAAGMILIFGGMFYLFYKLMFKPMINASRLQKTGLPGTAKIIEVKDTGVRINDNPQVKLTVEVKNSFGHRYTTVMKVLVSRINPGAYQPGMELKVKIDPNNELNVVPDFGATQSSAADTSAFKRQQEQAINSFADDSRQQDDILLSSGKPARAIIKKSTWAATDISGKQEVELEVEVLPPHSVSFSGVTKTMINPPAAHLFQPGCEINVKYDYYDNSKIVVDHS